MDFGENWECRGRWLVLAEESLLGLRFLIECFQNEHLGRVVVSVQLLHASMLVAVDAANAVEALLGLMERPAVLALVLVDVDAEGSLGQLLLAVGEPTLELVPAMPSLNPILAHLRLVLAI